MDHLLDSGRHLGEEVLALKGLRALVVDLDPQLVYFELVSIWRKFNVEEAIGEEGAAVLVILLKNRNSTDDFRVEFVDCFHDLFLVWQQQESLSIAGQVKLGYER